jgi:uncharacterized membrane protein
MMSTAEHRKLPRVVRIVRARPRLFLSACLGAVIAAWPGGFRTSTQLVVGWDVGVAVYLAQAFAMMARADIARLRRRAALQDEGRIAILVLTATAALASLGALIVELGTRDTLHDWRHLGLGIVTIVLSWAFTHTIFALHYAHEFYAEPGKEGGLAFPGKEQPDYWDFLYFSLVIGMTSQVSDVAVTTKTIRRTVLAHGVVAFVFNAALLALTVNIAASALQ